jgi:hypothetical protein
MDRCNRQKISKDIAELKNTITQLDIIYIYPHSHQKTAEYKLFSRSHGTFSKVDHILYCEAHLDKFERVEIMPCLLSEHKELNLK